MNSPRKTPAENALSDEDLRALARRHAMIYRQFRARIERERLRAEQQAAIYTMAQQMAAFMVSTAAAQAQQPAGTPPGAGAQNSQISEEPKTGTRAGKSAKKSDKKSKKPKRDAGGNAEKTTPAVPATDASGETGELYPEPVAARGGQHFAEPEISPLQRWARLVGADSLIVSIVLHVALFILALFWVVSVHVAEPEKAEESFFVSGSGGGRDGDSPSYADVQKMRRKNAKFGSGPAQHKIVTKASQAKFTLPEVPAVKVASGSGEFSSERFSRSLFGGSVSSGHGGGLGGGIGRGSGVGIGDGSNFVSKFKTKQKILGTSVTASRLAVYVDSSASMTEVLTVVREDVWKKFPTADIYEIFGCMMNARLSGTLAVRNASWERERAKLLASFEREKNSASARALRRKTVQTTSKMSQRKRRRGGYDFDNQPQEAWFKLLSSYGTTLYRRYTGSTEPITGPGGLDLASWLDMIFTEGGYDGIIVMADFQDYRDGGRYDESVLLEKWVKAARANGQRCYFFTTEMLPQKIFRDLAVLTGGDIAIPKETAKNSDEAAQTAAWIKKNRKTETVSTAEIASKKHVESATAASANFAESQSAKPAGTPDDDGPDDDFWNDDDDEEESGGGAAPVPATPAAGTPNASGNGTAVPAGKSAESGNGDGNLDDFFRDDFSAGE